MTTNKRFKFATMMASRHLLVSVLIAALSAALVFFVLYPYPYYAISGSLSIFLLMMVVDVGVGPLCTLVVASPKKSRKETLLDLLVIGGVQLSALGYGLHSLYIARPVFEVYERGNFRIVMANEVQTDEFTKALPQYQKLPLLGIHSLGTRQSKNNEEKLESIDMALAGIDIGMRPGWWIPFDDVRGKVKETYRPLSTLKPTPSEEKILTKSLKKHSLKMSDTYFLPLNNAKHRDWIVLLDENANIIGYAPISGYRDK